MMKKFLIALFSLVSILALTGCAAGSKGGLGETPMDAALRFAERGIGVAVVPAMVAVNRTALRATPFATPVADELTRTISIARRSDMAPTHAAAALQGLIREIADRLASLDHGLVSRV